MIVFQAVQMLCPRPTPTGPLCGLFPSLARQVLLPPVLICCLQLQPQMLLLILCLAGKVPLIDNGANWSWSQRHAGYFHISVTWGKSFDFSGPQISYLENAIVIVPTPQGRCEEFMGWNKVAAQR